MGNGTRCGLLEQRKALDRAGGKKDTKEAPESRSLYTDLQVFVPREKRQTKGQRMCKNAGLLLLSRLLSSADFISPLSFVL